MRLGEYKLVRKILDKACCLEFRVVEAKDSEDFEDDSPFTIADAAGERKFSMDICEIGHDWLEALLLEYRDGEEPEAAEKILEILQDATGGKLNPSDFCSLISDELLAYMEKALGEEIGAIDTRLGKFPEERQYWREQYRLEKARARKQHLLLDIRKRCRGTRKEEKEPGYAAGLEASWRQIRELARTLNYKENTDGCLEIDEIEEICQALIKRGGFEEEDWGLRKEILRGILSYGYHNCRGFHKPLKELAGKLYITDAETLEYADLLSEHDIYAGEAAELYRRYGKTEKYVRYLETHLGRFSKEYVELARCYCDAGNETRARETAEQGLKQCKDDLTDLFIFLLRDARKCKDKERYKKLYASAKRRKGADIVRVDAGVAM